MNATLIKNIYIHIPFCLRKCYYCSFPIQAIGKSKQNQQIFHDQFEKKYVEYLLNELNTTLKNENLDINLQSLYIGGGTPSLLENKSFSQIIQAIQKYTNIVPETEFTIECDPGTFNHEKIQFYNEVLKTNRLSVGVQSFNNSTLKQMNRSHSLEETFAGIQAIQQVPFFNDLKRVNFDLLINTPLENEDTLEYNLQQMVNLKPGHVSVYSMQVEPGSYFFEKVKYREGYHPCPTFEKQEQSYNLVHKTLVDNSYIHYEISNFALEKKYESVHNRMYWRGDHDFLGIGMGASSLQNRKRINRPRNLKKYMDFVDYLIKYKKYPIECIEDESSETEQLKVQLLGRLRTNKGIQLDDIPLCKLLIKIFGKAQQQRIKNILLQKKQSLKEYINYECLIKYNILKLNIPRGYLVCDEIIQLIL